MSALLIQGTYGGRVEQTGPRQLRSSYPHLFITVLLMFPVVLCCLGAIGMLVGAILDKEPGLLGGGAMGLAFSAGLFFIVRKRTRTMGNFELDVDAGTLKRVSKDREKEVWPIADIVGIQQQRDIFHRGFQRAYWLTIEVKDGRALRLGKGSAKDLSQTLSLLASWGLPVKRDAGTQRALSR